VKGALVEIERIQLRIQFLCLVSNQIAQPDRVSRLGQVSLCGRNRCCNRKRVGLFKLLQSDQLLEK